jgi:hypothetical protein
MQNLELLQKEKSKLEEVIEILTIEKTARKYIERYEEQLYKVKNAIQIHSIGEQEKIKKSCSRENCNCRCKK